MSRRIVHASVVGADQRAQLRAFVAPAADHVDAVDIVGFYLAMHGLEFVESSRVTSQPIDDDTDVVGATDIREWIETATRIGAA